MAIQVVRAREKAPSTANQFAAAFGNAIGDVGSAFFKNRAQKETAARDLLAKQQLLQTEYGLKGDLEGRKQAEKFEQQRNLLEQLGIGGFGRNEEKGSQLQGMSQNNQQETPINGQQMSRVPEETIYAAEIVGQHGLAQQMRDHNKNILDEKRRQEDIQRDEYKIGRKEHHEAAKPLYTELQQIRKNIPLQEQAIEDIMTASPGVGIRDYLADTFNFEPLRTSQGVKLKTAVKDFFLTDLTRAGGRPNMYIEQQIADALPKVGRDPEANQITAAGMKFKTDLAKKRVELIDKLSEEDEENFGYVKGKTLDSRVYKQMQKYVIDRQKQLADEIKFIKKSNPSNKQLSGKMVDVLGPDGEIYEVDQSEVESLPQGFRIQ